MKYVWIVFEFGGNFHSVHKTKISAEITMNKDAYAFGGYCERVWIKNKVKAV